jgi:predicted phage replisome organizer
MGVPWIKITTNIFDDDKIKLIDAMPDHDALIVIWFKLLTLAGRCNSAGCLYIAENMPYTDEMLAAVFSRPLTTVRMALDTFERLDMIERHDTIQLVNWEKHQNEAALEVIRKHDAERKKAQRTRGKAITSGDNVPDKSRKVPILDIDIEEDKDIEKEEENIIATPSAKNTRFQKPSLDEVKAYCKERNNTIDAQYFIDSNDAKGWVVGKLCTPMKDWRATIRTWERNDTKFNPSVRTASPDEETRKRKADMIASMVYKGDRK